MKINIEIQRFTLLTFNGKLNLLHVGVVYRKVLLV